MTITTILGVASIALPVILKVAQNIEKRPRQQISGGPLVRLRRFLRRNKIDYEI